MGHVGISWTFNGQVGILTVKWPLKGHGLMSFSNALIKIPTCLLGKQWENKDQGSFSTQMNSIACDESPVNVHDCS